MPASSTVRPTPKVRVPGQSSRPAVRAPSSRSERTLQMVPRMPIGHADPEDGLPVPLGQEATDQQAEEGSGDRGHHVDAERHTALVGRERVGEDRRRRRHQHRAADALNHPPADQPQRAAAEVERVERQRDRGEGEDDEAPVVDADPAQHVAEAAERDDQHRGDHEVAHQHPQQVTDVARRQRVEADAAEDGGQRDQDDRRVDGGQQGAQRGVGQHHPLVVRVVVVHPHPAARRDGLSGVARAVSQRCRSSRSLSSSAIASSSNIHREHSPKHIC